MSIKKEFILSIIIALVLLVIVFLPIKKKDETYTLEQPIVAQPVLEVLAITYDEVALHDQPNDCWTIINNKVYDLSGFSEDHPGGNGAIEFNCGKDGTDAFFKRNGKGPHSAKAVTQLEAFFKGNLSE